MSRTQGRLDSDRWQADGIIALSAFDLATVTGTGVLTRIAAGEFSLRFSNLNTACVVGGTLSGPVFRTGLQDYLQEQFGSLAAGGSAGARVPGFSSYTTSSLAAGNNVSIPVLTSGLTSGSVQSGFIVGSQVTIDSGASQEFATITGVADATHITVNTLAKTHSSGVIVSQNAFTTPAGVSGPPPFSGINQLTPVTAPRPKGIRLQSISVIYQITGASGITVPTVGVFQTTYGYATAPVVTTLLAQATNGLLTAANAQPYITLIPIANANKIWLTNNNEIITVELDFTSGAATSVLDVLGIQFNVDFNYN